jgi:hypothetical protein
VRALTSPAAREEVGYGQDTAMPTMRADPCTLLAARSLKNADFFGKSDPVCHCAVRNFGSNEPWKQLGHTGEPRGRSGRSGSCARSARKTAVAGPRRPLTASR